jgi:PAS domain S-box-containing protein
MKARAGDTGRVPWQVFSLFALLGLALAGAGTLLFVEAPLRRLSLATAAAVALLLAAAGLFSAFWERQRRLEASLLLEAERATLVAASRYAALMRSANDGILLADEELRLIDVNPRFEELSGFAREELLRMRVSDLRAPETRSDLESALDRVRRNDGGIYETVHRRKDGTGYPVEVSVRFVEVGGQRLLLAHVRDVSERRRAERQIRRLNAELEQRVAVRTAQLEESNRELESFSYSVSHDLRAPLRAIEGFSKILLELHAPAFEPEAQRMLGVVSANARRMSRLIDDLLAFSRLSRTDLRAQSVDMAALAREAFEELCPPEARARVRLEIGDLPPCRGDAALLRQVWTNLVGNALKFSSLRDPALIRIGGERRGGEIVYHVRDNGVGFDMQYADKLFGVFQRLHDPEQFEGTGVGLAIVQRVVRRHGGRVWADATPDGGALFGFALPGAAADDLASDG